MDQDRTLHFIAARPPGMDLELGRQVALSLARLATLQGCPVTYREFELLAPTLDSKTLCGVPLTDRIGVLWQSRFPQARVRAPAWPLKPGDLPALWLGPRWNSACLPATPVLPQDSTSQGVTCYKNKTHRHALSDCWLALKSAGLAFIDEELPRKGLEYMFAV